MSQMNIWRGLEGEVRAAGNVRLFDQAKQRRAALANYATIADVAAAIAPRSGASPAERESLVRAIVAEHQSSPRSLWTSMLAIAFRPMIARFGKRLGGMSTEEAEQFVLVAFIETVSAFSPGGCAILSLYWATRRAIYRPLARERARAADEIVFDEEDFVPTSPSGEALIDMVRFARLVATTEPKKSETPGTYVARVTGTKNWERRSRLQRDLRYSRAGDLAELRERFLHSINV
jgi:hypothetical protein